MGVGAEALLHVDGQHQARRVTNLQKLRAVWSPLVCGPDVRGEGRQQSPPHPGYRSVSTVSVSPSTDPPRVSFFFDQKEP